MLVCCHGKMEYETCKECEKMQELKESLEKAAYNIKADKELGLGDNPQAILRPAAKAWALFCLETLTGELLTKGLDISKALAEFCNEHEIT